MKGTSLNYQVLTLLNKHSDIIYLPDLFSFGFEEIKTSSFSLTLYLPQEFFHQNYEWKINGDDYSEDEDYKEKMQNWILVYLKKNKINFIQNVKIR